MFDTSQSTASGSRFNDILIKGRNNMNTLVEVVIADLHDKNTFHTYDQSTILQREKDWCLQRYIWQTELNLTKSPL